MKRPSPGTVLAAASDYVKRGWSPIPIPPRSKAPKIKGWQKLRLTEGDLPKYFDGKPQNIGLILGAPSGGLVDVDLDASEAVAVAPAFLPKTGMIHGRASKPRSHYGYISKEIKKTEKFCDTDGTVLVELRSTGGQTVQPPSTHPSGEAVVADEHDDPARVEARDLRSAVAKNAASALLARHWPKKGRHDVTLPLAGYLSRCGWSLAETQRFVDVTAGAAHDEEPEDRSQAVRDTFAKLAAGEPTSGKPKLIDLFGQETVKRLEKFLRLGGLLNRTEPIVSADQNADNSDVGMSVDRALAPSKSPVRIRRRKAAQIVIEDLLRRGDLMRVSGNRQFWFDRTHTRLIDLDTFDFRTLLLDIYRVNPAEPEFKHIFEAIRGFARIRGKEAAVHRFAFYDQVKNQLYLAAGNGRVIVLDGKTARWTANGTDGVLFEDNEGPQTIPVESTTAEINGDPLHDCIFSRVNFIRGAAVILTAEQQRLALHIWMLAIFFPELLPAKVLMLMYGEKGSGKSTTVRVILKLLLGPNANVTPLGKEDGFNATVTHEYLIGFDNVDSRCAWIEDRLATVATGQTIRLRKLYTTNEMATFPTRCALALTARTPRFRRDDIVDRLLVFRVDRLEKFGRESEWYAEIERLRTHLWAQILRDLNRIVARLSQSLEAYPDNIRMGDWAFLASVIGDALGKGDEIRAVLQAAEVDKASFLLETDALYDLLHDLAYERPGHEWKAGALFEELKDRAGGSNRDFSIKSSKSLGRILHRLEPTLKMMIRFSIRHDTHAGQDYYTLGPLKPQEDLPLASPPQEDRCKFRDPDF